MSNQNLNEINNEDLSKIQDEIDILEQKLFSDNSNTNISLNKLNITSESNNYNSIHLNSDSIDNKEFIIDKIANEKVNEKSYKFINDNIIQNYSENKGNDNIKIEEYDESDKSKSNIDTIKQKEKIKQLIELQKEIDKLRQEKTKKINNKLNKIYKTNNNNINKKEKNKYKTITKK